MRKNLKSLAPTLWFVIIAFIISIFAVWGGAGRLGESRNANIIVSVGKEKISTDIYMQDLMQRLEMLKTKFKELDKKLYSTAQHPTAGTRTNHSTNNSSPKSQRNGN